MSTPTQTPAELAAANDNWILKREQEVKAMDNEKLSREIQDPTTPGDHIMACDEAARRLRAIDAEKKALIDSICEGRDLELMEDRVRSDITITGPNWPKTQSHLSALLTLVSRVKRAKEGKGV